MKRAMGWAAATAMPSKAPLLPIVCAAATKVALCVLGIHAFLLWPLLGLPAAPRSIPCASAASSPQRCSHTPRTRRVALTVGRVRIASPNRCRCRLGRRYV